MSRRAVLLNDCRVADHLGTRLVYDSLARLCLEFGIEIVKTYPVGFNRWDRQFVDALRDVDLVLANGEGTLHHDAPAARALIDGAAVCQQAGCSVVLLNTVWQSNPGLASGLRHFARIYVRETLSQREVRSAGFSAEVVPDLSLAAPVGDGVASGTQAPFVTDSVDRDLAIELARWARRKQYPFQPMRAWLGRWAVRHPIQAVRGLLANPQVVRPLDLADMPAVQNARFVLTGRFHGACLAIGLGVPFLAFESNSHKSIGLCADLGRPDLCFDRAQWSEVQRRTQEWEVGADDLDAVRSSITAYRKKAVNDFRSMMQEIVALP